MSYERYETRRRTKTYGSSSRRTTFGYWVPLAFTITVATIGLAAWIWKESRDNDEYEHDRKNNRPPPGYGDVGPGQTSHAPGPNYQPPMGPSGEPPGPQGPPGPEGYPPPPGAPPQSYEPPQQEEQGVMSRVTEVLRRTPSPQQILDVAGRRVTAGVAAAGAAVGSALSSIREEDRVEYEDHSRWSEEAVSQRQDQQGVQTQSSPRSEKRKTVAIVVSAKAQHHHDGDNATHHQEHASILSHLPEHVDDKSKLFVLIYSPDLKQHPAAANGPGGRPPPSITSSYSNIEYEDLRHSTDDIEKPLAYIDPQPLASASSTMFNGLYAQARALTEKETMIMPFTTPSGYIQILRQIAPQVVYLQATLSGDNGEHVKNISGWVGQVVLVVGDESGHGGLVDSEDERGAIGEEVRQRWWQHDGQVGLGQIELVEGLRVGEDWRRRVRGHD